MAEQAERLSVGASAKMGRALGRGVLIDMARDAAHASVFQGQRGGNTHSRNYIDWMRENRVELVALCATLCCESWRGRCRPRIRRGGASFREPDRRHHEKQGSEPDATGGKATAESKLRGVARRGHAPHIDASPGEVDAGQEFKN